MGRPHTEPTPPCIAVIAAATLVDVHVNQWHERGA
jgi:hypothetical protein